MKFSVCLIFPLGSCFVEPFHADLWIKLLILDFASFAGWGFLFIVFCVLAEVKLLFLVFASCRLGTHFFALPKKVGKKR